MRLLLFTGKGGAGTSTCAAATAAHLGATGRKTLLLSLTGDGSLGDVCAASLGLEPVEIAGSLYAAEPAGHEPLEVAAFALGRAIEELVLPAGFAPDVGAMDGEWGMLAGAESLSALGEVLSQTQSGRWEAIVVDCGPAAEAVRTLALPGTMSSYLRRLAPLPPRSRTTTAAREAAAADRLLGRAAPATPRAAAFEAIVELHGHVAGIVELLADPATTARVVVGRQRAAAEEASRTVASLALHGIGVDALMAPSAADEDARILREIFSPRPIAFVPHLRSGPTGVDDLCELGATIYGGDDPVAAAPAPAAVRVDRVAAGYVLSLALPFVQREELDLIRRGDELVVTVQRQRRAVTIPSALRRCTVTGATLADGRLSVEFSPDPALWLRS